MSVQSLPPALVHKASSLGRFVDENPGATAAELVQTLDELELAGTDRQTASAYAASRNPQTLRELCRALGTDEATLRSQTHDGLKALADAADPIAGRAEIEAFMAERSPRRLSLGSAGERIRAGFNASREAVVAPLRRRAAEKTETAISEAAPKKRGIRVGDGDAPERVRNDHIRAFIAEAKEAFDALPGSGTQILDGRTGKYRSVSPRDMAAARRLVAEAERVLPGVELNASPYPSSLNALLSDPDVGQRLLSEMGNTFSPRLYVQGLEVLRGVTQDEPSLAEKKQANIARQGNRRFRADTLARVGTVKELIELNPSGKTLNGESIADLVATTAPLLDGLVGLDLRITDEVTGFARGTRGEDFEIAHRILRLVSKALAGREVRVAEKHANLPSILSHPDVAACILEHAKPASKAQFQREYGIAVDLLRAIDTSYNTRVIWGSTDDQDRGLTVIAARKHAPRDVLDALQDLTYAYFDGITHLWFAPLMAEDPSQSREYESLLRSKLDDQGRALLDVLVDYRDSDSIRVVAARDGKRDAIREVALRGRFAPLGRKTASGTITSDYYNGISDGMAKQVLTVVGVGTLIGKGLDYGTSALGMTSLELWKPTILGGWDDVLGTFPNIKEMLEIADRFKSEDTRRMRRRGAIVDGAIAAGVGLGTSAALTLPLWFLGGQSFASLMLGPGADPVSKAASWAVYGAASSGGTATLSILPGLRNRAAVRRLVNDGIVEPTAKGKPLNGAAREA
ncbi:MAG: hypothetical protein AAF654_04380 [Myxococcota bacterium]